MHPTLHVPSAALGLVLMLLGAFWCWYWRRKEGEERGAWPFGLVLAGGGLIAVFAWRTITWPTYGFMMMLGCLAVTVFSVRWVTQRKLLTMEQTLELLVISGVCGLIGARAVFLVEQWDVHFADQPPVLRTGKLDDAPLAKGDVLRLRVHGEKDVEVRFEGSETLTQVRDAIRAQAGPQGVTARVLTTEHRGDDGLAVTERGLLLETERRGPRASLEVIDPQAGAAAKLGPITGRAQGLAVPWTKVFDLRMGGLTYFGSVFGILLSSFIYLRLKTVSYLRMLDAVAPVLPLGLFFGRMGCLSRSCCWGREIGDDALLGGLEFPAWSLPWRQMVDERLGCNADIALGQGQSLSEQGQPLTAEIQSWLTDLGPLADGTPPLHAAQLYEGLACIAIFALVWAYRERLQTKVGQAFVALVFLQAPVRFVVEHFRRDHDVFWAPFGYLLTESQTVAALLVVAAAATWVFLHKKGTPLAPPTEASEPQPEPAPETAA